MRIARGSGREESEVKDLLSRFKDMRDLLSVMGGGKVRGKWKKMKGVKKMLSGGMGLGMDGGMPGLGADPMGLPEIGRGKIQSKKAAEKRRKKSKQAKKDRKKARKR
jgi:hypothetical protein